MKLDLDKKQMDIGTFAFNFARTLMVAGTGGADLGECLLASSEIRDGDAESWIVAWTKRAERAQAEARRASDDGDLASACGASLRASNYYRAAMFSLAANDARFDALLTASRECFHAGARLSQPAIEVVDIPFGEARLPAYFVADGRPRRPTLLVVNGGDSTNEEMVHWIGFAARARGWNCLTFEGPGQWSALQRNPGLRMRPDFEVPTAAVLDYLVARPEVDPDRIALFGPSLGAMLAARIAAFDPRIRACICDGLIVDVHEAWRAVWPELLRLAPDAVFDAAFATLERLSPQLRGVTNRFRAMHGVELPHEVIEAWKPYSIRDLGGRLHCPMLLLYGEAELAQSDGHVMLDLLRFMLTLRTPAELDIFPYEAGWAASHCHIGGLVAMQARVFAWLAHAFEPTERRAGTSASASTFDMVERYLRRTPQWSEGAPMLAELRSAGHDSRPTAPAATA